jgi:hypothetical protein
MLRDILKDNTPINLTNYARPKYFWREEDMSVYVDNFHKEGFRVIEDNSKVEEYRPLDVFLVGIPDPQSLKKTITNHCLIYLGNGYVIHHRIGQLSSVDRYRGALKNLTTHYIRHKDIPDMRNSSASSVNLMDVILPHKKAEIEEALNANRP